MNESKTSEHGLEIDDETVRATRESVEGNSSVLLDARLANLIFLQLDDVNLQKHGERKESVVRALLSYTWTQRLYFVVRSTVMGFIGTILTASIVFVLGTVNAIQAALIGVASFIATLVITRLFEAQITQSSKAIVQFLSRYKRLRGVILNHF